MPCHNKAMKPYRQRVISRDQSRMPSKRHGGFRLASFHTAQAHARPGVPDGQLKSFFLDAENFHARTRVSAIIYAVGPFDSQDDQDRGTWVYEWRRRSIRVRVITASGFVESIALMNPARVARFDRPLQTLWPRPVESITSTEESQLAPIQPAPVHRDRNDDVPSEGEENHNPSPVWINARR